MKKKDILALREGEVAKFKRINEKDILRAKCDHKNDKGHSALRPTDNENVAKCKICQAKLNLKPADLAELTASCKDVVNAIQCIKAAYEGTDSEILDQLGALILQLNRVPDWYTTVYVSKRAEAEEEKFNDYGSNGTMFINTSNFGNNGIGFAFSDNPKKKKNKGGKGKKHKGKKGYKGFPY